MRLASNRRETTARAAAWSRFDHDRGKRQEAVVSPIYGYLAVCSEHIDGATLYFEDATRSVEDRSVEVGEWTADRPVTSLASWSRAKELRAGPQRGHWQRWSRGAST